MSTFSERKKKSFGWDYFIYDAVTESSTCSVKHANVECGKPISSSNSTNLISQLRACHEAQYAEVEKKEEKEKTPPQHIDQNHRQLRSASLTACNKSIKHGADNV